MMNVFWTGQSAHQYGEDKHALNAANGGTDNGHHPDDALGEEGPHPSSWQHLLTDEGNSRP